MRHAITLVLLLALPASARPLEGVASTGTTAADFAPVGWTVERSLEGDLDGDATADLVVVLLQQAEVDQQRALLWLKGTPKKGYALVDSNLGLLACFSCLGMKGGDAAPTLEIKKRVLIVSHWGGSREAYGSTHRFRLEKGVPSLIGVDHQDADTMTGQSSSTSENLLTGVTVVDHTSPSVDENGAPRKSTTARKSTKKKPAPLRRFSEVVEYGVK